MHNIYIEVFEGISREEQLALAKEIGYTGFFSGPDYAHDLEELKTYRELGENLGLDFETVHATIPGCSDIWYEGKKGDQYIDLLVQEVDYCAQIGVPIMIIHVQTDMREGAVFELGAKRYERVVQAAGEKGIQLAIENADDEDLMYRMMAYFPQKHVGFCYDSGHEACVTPGARFLPDLGNRLLCTHLHDNNGKKDLHQLPFDGVIDFEQMAADLKAIGWTGNLTFELRYNEAYAQKYSKREFLEECYKRALKFKEMIEK